MELVKKVYLYVWGKRNTLRKTGTPLHYQYENLNNKKIRLKK